MANELGVTVSLNFLKMGAKLNVSASDSFNVTGDSFVNGVHEVGTSEEELVQLADLGTPGWCYVKNLDETNYVQIGTVTSEYCIRLLAGEFCLFRMDGTSLFAKANTAVCLVQYAIIEA